MAHALLALRRAIRARRQLNRLAPHLFDVGVIQHAAREQHRKAEEARPWQQAIATVYGVPEAEVMAKWPTNELPEKPLHPATRRAVERAAAERELWFQVARDSLDAYGQHQPHHLPGLSQIAQMLDLASQLGRLATGLETQHQPDPDPIEPHLSFQAMLERVYGSQEMTASPTPGGVETV